MTIEDEDIGNIIGALKDIGYWLMQIQSSIDELPSSKQIDELNENIERLKE